MSKKKTEVSQDITNDILQSLIVSIGEDIVSTGRDLIETKREIIPVGPRLNTILSGGIPEGTLVLISGKPKSCKSTTILQFLQICQSLGRRTWYWDVETRLKEMNINGIKGLDPEKLIHIKSRSQNLLTAEKILSDILRVLKDDPRCVVVLDSLSALITEAEYTKELSGTGRTDLHKLLSMFYKQASALLNINKGIFIGVNHIIANVGNTSSHSPWIESGSIKGQYYSDIRLRIKYSQLWEEKEQVIGQKVNWICDCSALGAPGGQCESFVRYGVGIDSLYERILMAIDAGLIQKKGAWFQCNFINNHSQEEKPVQFQGEAKLYNTISSNPDYVKWLEEDLKELGVI